jgi:PPOX class probable FMN-dependent enzyme
MIDNQQTLRSLYGESRGLAPRKKIAALDRHCAAFVALSPFVVLATGSKAGQMDSSPRGGAPGFVKLLDQRTLLIPDASGNNLLDSLSNIVEHGRIGLLFLVPGVDETLRVNGHAHLSRADEHLAPFAGERHAPKLAVVVQVEEAYLHCAKSLMRSKLWHDSARVPRSVLPTIGKMISDQIGIEPPAETQEQMVARYQADL